MKLYALKLSHYAARARIALLLKGAPVEIISPGWEALRSADYRTINPMGRVPCLITDDGTSIPESGVILEYAHKSDSLRRV